MMKQLTWIPTIVCTLLAVQGLRAQDAPMSAHAAQELEMAEEAKYLPEEYLAMEGVTKDKLPPPVPKSAQPNIADDFVVLGYVQNNEGRFGFHWHVLTHVALPFTNFNADGNVTNPGSITGRSIIYRPGGMADRHGVQVIMALRNDGFNLSILDSVMQDPAKRATLVSDVANLINNPNDNMAGVNLDLEPAWTDPATRDGVYAFVQELHAALDSDKKISWYIEPSYTNNRYGNIGSVAQYIDFFNYSCYPWAGSWSTTATSIVNRSGYVFGANRIDRFIQEGIPPEKLVLTLGSYGNRWNTDVPSENPADAYGSSVNSNIGSWGFADALFETTLSANLKTRFFNTPSFSPYFASQISGSTFRTVVYEDEAGVELKARDALSWPGGEASGRRLRGVGFWSLRWMANNSFGSFNSHDLESESSSPKIRTYPHLYQITQEVLAPPGLKTYIIEKWEYFDSALLGSSLGTTFHDWMDRWRDPDEGPDSVGLNSASRAIVPVPGGPGQPDNSEYCLQLDFDFSATAGNQFFYRWEILGDNSETTVADINAVPAVLSQATIVKADLHTPVAIPNATIRFVLMDANGELELGPAETLNATGWRTMEWDLTTGAAAAYTTSFNQYNSGNGTIDTTPGERDLAIVGFLVEGGGSASSGMIHLDELRWSPTVTGERYLINEFAYRNNSNEFVEIYGPPGTIPAGMELRFYQGSNGAVYKTVDISGQTIPASGVLAFGTPGSGAAINTGFSDGVDDISNTAPAGIQIYNTITAEMHDSVVYRAFGGLGLLGRAETNGLTSNGYPWIGEEATGGYSLGRYPDGNNTGVNANDFSVMPLSVGQPNGAEISLPVNYDFDTMPAEAFIAYSWLNAGAVASGVGASPSGGNVLRVADSSGGNIGFIGDSSLGADGNGYEVTGEIYITGSSEPDQAIGVGFCGTQGSTFFTFFPNNSGYENGYWLLYHNRATTELNNGLGNHNQEFKFVMAQNNNMQADQVVELASATRASTGAPDGGWTTFRFAIEPGTDTLIAEIGGTEIYNGPIPEGGRTSGAVQIGHRERHGTGTSAVEGAWVDNITIGTFSIIDPTVEITTNDVASAGYTNSPVDFTATFSEGVSGFGPGGIDVTNGTVGNFNTQSASVYTFTVTGDVDGLVEVSIPANEANALDPPNNPNQASNVFSYNYDVTAPTSEVTSAPATLVGTTVDLSFETSDALSGVAETALWVKAPGESSFADTGLTETGTSGSFEYTASASGLHEFYTRATDNAGNVEAAPGSAQASVVVNVIPNGVVPLDVPVDTSVTLTFPMTEDINITITLNNVTTAGAVTVSRTEGNSGAADADLNTNRLIDQSWTIAVSGGLAFDTAMIVVDYDDDLLGLLTEAEIDAAFRVVGTDYTMFSVTVDTLNKTLTITGVDEFSDWYAGNEDATQEETDIGEWFLLD